MGGTLDAEQGGEYVVKLLKVFSDCEDLEDMESLRILCAIFKAIVALNDTALMEVRRAKCYVTSFLYVFMPLSLGKSLPRSHLRRSRSHEHVKTFSIRQFALCWVRATGAFGEGRF